MNHEKKGKLIRIRKIRRPFRSMDEIVDARPNIEEQNSKTTKQFYSFFDIVCPVRSLPSERPRGETTRAVRSNPIEMK